MGDLFLIAAIALGFGGGAGALAGWLLLRSSGPVVTADALNQLTRVRGEWQAWQTGAEAMLESMDELSDTIKRRRNRESARQANEARQDGAPLTRDALLARARAQGHPV